jgi:SAM-dependent methyltransferase
MIEMQEASVAATLPMPSAIKNGRLVPTMNRFGTMLTMVIDPVKDFIEFASQSPHWCLDIGSAYGVFTLAAIEAGARVMANDLDARHLEILRSQVPADKQSRLRTVLGAFPDVDLGEQQFGAILACRVFHFFDGPTLEVAAAKTLQMLVPGGKLFVRAMTPYLGLSPRVVPVYEQRKAQGERWPGYIDHPGQYIDDKEERDNCPDYAHYLDPEVLRRTFEEAGFIVERCEFVAIDLEPVKLDGREGVLLVARKP